MADVFAITVKISGAYPSVNHVGRDGFRGGRKSPEYHALRDSVTRAAREEMARTGWTCAEYDVQGWITRYHRARRRLDAGNLGKGEMDFLQAAGVIMDDQLVRPLTLSTEFDPEGEDRITIILLRQYPPMINFPAKAVIKKKRARLDVTPRPRERERMGSLNGVPTSRSELLRMIQRAG